MADSVEVLEGLRPAYEALPSSHIAFTEIFSRKQIKLIDVAKAHHGVLLTPEALQAAPQICCMAGASPEAIEVLAVLLLQGSCQAVRPLPGNTPPRLASKHAVASYL